MIKIATSLAWDPNVTLNVQEIQAMDERGELKRNFDRPIIKDTVAMPLQGYAIVRFVADNPGFWMLHCHMDSHSDPGMMMILKVGETSDFPPMPDDWSIYDRD